MDNNLQENTVAVQDDTTKVTPSGQTVDQSNGESTSNQSTEMDIGDDKLDSNLPPELVETRKQLMRDYHSKTQKVKEEETRLRDSNLRQEQEVERLKNESGTLRELMKQQWFNEAAERERLKRNGVSPDTELSDEEFEAIRNDKRAFKAALRREAEAIVNAKVAPKLHDSNQRLQALQTEREFELVASNPKYKDFRSLNDKGVLEPYLKQGFNYESAYKQYWFDNERERMSQDIEKRATALADERLQTTRDGAVAKNGVPRINGSLNVEMSGNFDDDFDKLMELAGKGYKDVKLVSKKK